MGSVCAISLPLPPVNPREILRYAGMQAEDPAVSLLLEDTLTEVIPHLSGRVCWQEFSITDTPQMLDLGFVRTNSLSLKQHLSGCSKIVLFAATLGLPFDRLISRYSRLSPARALLLQAIGTERMEGLCDAFCEKVRLDAASRGLCTTSRFSPGYGDLPLEIQTCIFRVLDCPKQIGLTLNESLLMSPSKSVTAIIGLSPNPTVCRSSGCSSCTKTDCIYRRSL